MRLAASVLVLFVLGCGAGSSDDSAEWQAVLHHKKAAAASDATTTQKQMYADSLAAFVHRNPHHSRAREVYELIQVDFARELAALGRHQDAIRFYRAVLAQNPDNERALEGLKLSLDQLAVSREKLLSLEKGMSPREVSKVLGKPIPGWTVKRQRRDAVLESWYYRKTDGAVAGVYFRDGKLFAAEENSSAKIAPLVGVAETH
jgi:tetratricopeptide (TPR) repeat protein